MLKTEIGREQLDFVSDNLSANFNAYFRIFIFLSSISKSPHPPTHPRRNIFEKTSSDKSFTLDKSESTALFDMPSVRSRHLYRLFRSIEIRFS